MSEVTEVLESNRKIQAKIKQRTTAVCGFQSPATSNDSLFMPTSQESTNPDAPLAGKRAISAPWSIPLFIILSAASLTIWVVPLLATFALALRDDQYTHILLILPMSAALIFLDSRDVNRRTQHSKGPQASSLSGKIGSGLLALALLISTFVKWRAFPPSYDEQLSIDMIALVLWWIASFILCFDIQAFRRSLFPLCFLFWMVPFPNILLNPIISLLQYGSAAAAHLLFLIARIPVAQRGTLVHIPGLTMEVAPECSSIRSSMILLVTSMVLAHLLLRSRWRKITVVAAAIPLSVLKNGLRIFVLGMLATRVDPSFLTGRLHRQGGIIFLLIALAMIFLLIWILRRGEGKAPIDAPGQT
jgi:exosortase